MISSNGNRKMNLLLVLVIGTAATGIVNQSSAYPRLSTHPTARVTAFALAIGIPSFIRLNTKGCPKELKFKKKLDGTWQDCFCNWFKILKVWNIIFHPCEYIKLVDKCWVGTKLSTLDIETKEISKDGLKEVTVMDKKLKCLPTGVCGKIDAYVFKQFEKLYNTIGDIEKALILCYALHGIDIEKIKKLWFPIPKKA